MTYDNRIAGRIISRLRQERGLTQEVLSGLAGLARSHLAEIENGRICPCVDTLWRIADALDLRLSDLIRLIEEANEQNK